MWNVIDNLLFAAKAIGCACTVFTFIRLVTGESQTALKWSFPLLEGKETQCFLTAERVS
ncbi:TPA: hypothetical protein ACX3IV_004193 [Vibrio parahaemolyticus]|uniref:hypothetical protein n=1 Tax=Vibrio parahaemolyticus TaxID=670 RepID=UPI0022B54CD4|nr:hypothetical protein [Vibrio parahaemolyticus]EGU0149958.1 hypothetical protein [Vibrio parahaemolyticus]MCZ6381939.1 hypothetical protein [Vibrio parahaemolyticus]